MYYGNGTKTKTTSITNKPKSASKRMKRGMVIYKSYNFVDKDPAIDVVRGMVQTSNMKYGEIHDKGGPTPTCLWNWFDGKTKRPQFCTLIAATRAVGGDFVFVDRTGQQIKLPAPPKSRRA